MPFGPWMLALYFASLYVTIKKNVLYPASLYSMLVSNSVLRCKDVSLLFSVTLYGI
jgi:hypothetical protein